MLKDMTKEDFFDKMVIDRKRVDFLMFMNRYEMKVYQAGLKFILYVATKKVLDCDVIFSHSLDKGIYVQVDNNQELTYEQIDAIKTEMRNLISQDITYGRKMVLKKDAYLYYQKHGELEKAGNTITVNQKAVNLYELGGYYNYFYMDLPDSTGKTDKFNLIHLGANNLLLSHPVDIPNVVPEYKPQVKILESFREYDSWIKAIGVSYVNDLNNIIANSKIRSFIKQNDIMMNNRFFNIAKQIQESGAKIILLGGPSSSGKTTSTKKLALYLSTLGLNPIYLGLDDYYKERVDSPKDENGEYDFERLDAIDVELFNTQLKNILEGKEVEVPKFNFVTGEKEYKGRVIKLAVDDIILIEGLHCLNEELTHLIPKEQKLKIYISPFTPLSIDRHNHISTIDIRLIRRMIRDSWSRGFPPELTLQMWGKVRAGETKYVFPFTTEADIILNTAFIYEIGILRVYGEPLLYSIPPESEYYKEARRLLNFMQMFLPIPSDHINDDNILREFIGGSYFEER